MEASVVALKIDRASVEGVLGENGAVAAAVVTVDFEGSADECKSAVSWDDADGSCAESEEPAEPYVAVSQAVVAALPPFDVQCPPRYEHPRGQETVTCQRKVLNKSFRFQLSSQFSFW